jgi:hypothetical protein
VLDEISCSGVERGVGLRLPAATYQYRTDYGGARGPTRFPKLAALTVGGCHPSGHNQKSEARNVKIAKHQNLNLDFSYLRVTTA